MARLQILELPTVHVGNATETPFALVIDQADENTFQHLVYGTTLDTDGNQRSTHEALKDQLGARAILAFEDTIDIPANGTPDTETPLSDYDVRTAIAADEHAARTQAELAADRLRLAHERTDIARNMDRLAKRKNELLEALGMNSTRDWDDIRDVAAHYLAAIERVRRLHQPVEHRGQTICWECSNYDFPGQTTDTPPVTYDQCRTLQAITGEPDTPDGQA